MAVYINNRLYGGENNLRSKRKRRKRSIGSNGSVIKVVVVGSTCSTSGVPQKLHIIKIILFSRSIASSYPPAKGTVTIPTMRVINGILLLYISSTPRIFEVIDTFLPHV